MDRVDEREASKAIALKAIRGVFIERDARVVQELFAPDFLQPNPTTPSGRDAIGALVGSLPEGFRYEPGMVVAEGSIVMIHGRYVGWAPEPMVAVDIFASTTAGSSNTGMSCRPRSRPMKQNRRMQCSLLEVLDHGADRCQSLRSVQDRKHHYQPSRLRRDASHRPGHLGCAF